MKGLLFFLAAALAACSSPPQCKCGPNTACVFVGNEASSRCVTSCDGDGGCPAGLSCGCAATCQGCKDCARVCQQ